MRFLFLLILSCFFATSSIAQNTEWYDYRTAYFEYNGKEVVGYKWLDVDLDGNEILNSTAQHSYDKEGNRTQTVYQIWSNKLNNLTPHSRLLYAYTSESKGYVRQNWKSNEWVNDTEESHFTSALNAQSFSSSNNQEQVDWTKKEYKDGAWNEHKKRIVKDRVNITQINKNGIWTNEKKITNQHSSKNKQIQIIEKWDSKMNVWLNDKRITTIKTSKNKSTNTIQTWDVALNEWINHSKTITQLENGKLVEQITKKWILDESKWLNELRVLCTYQNGLGQKKVMQKWSGGLDEPEASELKTDIQLPKLILSGTETIYGTLSNPYQPGTNVLFENLNPTNTYNLSIYNSQGQAVYSKIISGDIEHQTKLESVNKQGWYIVTLQTDDKIVFSRKIIVVQ